MRARPQRTLKSRALQLLAQRDQSRIELRRKLLRQLRKEAAALAAGASGEAGSTASPLAKDDDAAPAGKAGGEAEVETLLDWLAGHGFLSDERFVEARIHARESRFGNLRIRSELARHGLAPPPDVARALAESELDRAAAVRERRFASAPATPAERSSQARFLVARGFSPEVVGRLMRQLERGSGSTRQAG